MLRGMFWMFPFLLCVQWQSKMVQHCNQFKGIDLTPFPIVFKGHSASTKFTMAIIKIYIHIRTKPTQLPQILWPGFSTVYTIPYILIYMRPEHISPTWPWRLSMPLLSLHHRSSMIYTVYRYWQHRAIPHICLYYVIYPGTYWGSVNLQQ